jgi:hypothetical protein
VPRARDGQHLGDALERPERHRVPDRDGCAVTAGL